MRPTSALLDRTLLQKIPVARLIAFRTIKYFCSVFDESDEAENVDRRSKRLALVDDISSTSEETE